MGKMSIETKLSLDVFHTDEDNAHIILNTDYTNEEEIKKLVLACPAGLYKYEDGKLSFSYLGCLECGTCRVLSHDKVIKEWNHPSSGIGVTFKQG